MVLSDFARLDLAAMSVKGVCAAEREGGGGIKVYSEIVVFWL